MAVTFPSSSILFQQMVSVLSSNNEFRMRNCYRQSYGVRTIGLDKLVLGYAIQHACICICGNSSVALHTCQSTTFLPPACAQCLLGASARDAWPPYCASGPSRLHCSTTTSLGFLCSTTHLSIHTVTMPVPTLGPIPFQMPHTCIYACGCLGVPLYHSTLINPHRDYASANA